mgnify:CR=1 FL=1
MTHARTASALLGALLLCVLCAPAMAQGQDGEIIKKTVVSQSNSMSVFEITYWSTGLRVKGFLFQDPRKATKSLPGVVFNHGGVDGVPRLTKERCKQLAAQGFVVFAPSFRGEDGSEGEIEVAGGEVDDAISAAILLMGWPGVNKSRIAMVGASHGGIVSLLAATRMNFKAVACIYGVTNTHTWYHNHLIAKGMDVSDPLSVKVYGKYPDGLKPEAFRKRAPALDADKINSPVLLLYGDKDEIVPVSQGLEMKAALEKLKKPVKMKIIKGASHGFLFRFESGKPKAERAMAQQGWDEMLAFLRKYLK